jgi:hypothetical protein
MDRVLFIDLDGKLFITEPPDQGLQEITASKHKRLNRVSSADWCFWVVSSDLEVFLHVNSRENPISACVTTYENQV